MSQIEYVVDGYVRVITVSTLETRKLHRRENKALFRTKSVVLDSGSWLSPTISGGAVASSSCALSGLYPRGGRDAGLVEGIL